MPIITTAKSGAFAINGVQVINFKKGEELRLDVKNANRMIELKLAEPVEENKMNNNELENKDNSSNSKKKKK